ncbi:hypothetical protein GQ457_08G023210 [Hibiscus cannabinus]
MSFSPSISSFCINVSEKCKPSHLVRAAKDEARNGVFSSSSSSCHVYSSNSTNSFQKLTIVESLKGATVRLIDSINSQSHFINHHRLYQPSYSVISNRLTSSEIFLYGIRANDPNAFILPLLPFRFIGAFLVWSPSLLLVFLKKINVTLDDSNYLLWQQQVFYRLQKFIDGNVTWPLQYIRKDGNVSINPEFELYEEQDRALASWLLSTVSEDVLPHLIGHNTSSDIWNTLHRLYSGKTTSRLMSFRRLLHLQKKES